MLYIPVSIWHQSFLHPSIKISLEGEGRSVFLSETGGCCGVSSVTERKPEVQFSSQDLDTPGQREKILRAGSFPWGLIHSLLCLGDVGAGEELGLVSELEITIFY